MNWREYNGRRHKARAVSGFNGFIRVTSPTVAGGTQHGGQASDLLTFRVHILNSRTN